MDIRHFRITSEGKAVEDVELYRWLDGKIHLYYGLKGGMEKEEKDTKLIFHNCNGFPSDKNNKHKIKQYN